MKKGTHIHLAKNKSRTYCGRRKKGLTVYSSWERFLDGRMRITQKRRRTCTTCYKVYRKKWMR